jgi:hypothetical protein
MKTIDQLAALANHDRGNHLVSILSLRRHAVRCHHFDIVSSIVRRVRIHHTSAKRTTVNSFNTMAETLHTHVMSSVPGPMAETWPWSASYSKRSLSLDANTIVCSAL